MNLVTGLRDMKVHAKRNKHFSKRLIDFMEELLSLSYNEKHEIQSLYSGRRITDNRHSLEPKSRLRELQQNIWVMLSCLCT